MEINSKEYLTAEEDVVRRNFNNRRWLKRNERWEVILPFIGRSKTILSVGGGAVEPTIINATHAVDIVPIVEHYLQLLKWKGYFKCASCTDIPAPDKYFDVAVCCEVIEHLPTLDDVKKTFDEVHRVAKLWIFSTPANPLGPKNPEIDHKIAFTIEDLKILTAKYHAEAFTKGMYNFVKKT